MKKSFVLVFALSMMVFSACTGTAQKQKEAREKSSSMPENSAISQEIFIPAENVYQLAWEDNFDGTALDPAKWNYRATGPRRIGYNSPSMVKVKDGNLHLMFDVRNDSILGAMIGNLSTFMSGYGYYE